MGSLMTSSIANSAVSGSSNSLINVILPLKNIIKTRDLTKFDIATENEQEKKPLNVEEDIKKTNTGLQTKIKVLLDQRKPPTEIMPSLCEMYDEDLNLVKK